MRALRIYLLMIFVEFQSVQLFLIYLNIVFYVVSIVTSFHPTINLGLRKMLGVVTQSVVVHNISTIALDVSKAFDKTNQTIVTLLLPQLSSVS